MKNVILIKLCDFNLINSINLKSIILFVKIGFESLIYIFSLIVCFRIINNREFYFNAKMMTYLTLKMINKL